MEMNLCALLNSSGLFSLSQMSLQKGDIACSGVPVAVYIAILSGLARSFLATGQLRLSAQVIIGADGSQFLTTMIKLCMALLKPMAMGCAAILPVMSLITA